MSELKVINAPIHCANCYQQEPGIHIQFPAAFDGPVLNQNEKLLGSGVEVQAIDELVLCEKCLKAAAKLIGLQNVPDLLAEREAQKLEMEHVEEELRQARQATKVLADAISAITPYAAGAQFTAFLAEAKRIGESAKASKPVKEIDMGEVTYGREPEHEPA